MKRIFFFVSDEIILKIIIFFSLISFTEIDFINSIHKSPSSFNTMALLFQAAMCVVGVIYINLDVYDLYIAACNTTAMITSILQSLKSWCQSSE